MIDSPQKILEQNPQIWLSYDILFAQILSQTEKLSLKGNFLWKEQKWHFTFFSWPGDLFHYFVPFCLLIGLNRPLNL